MTYRWRIWRGLFRLKKGYKEYVLLRGCDKVYAIVWLYLINFVGSKVLEMDT